MNVKKIINFIFELNHLKRQRQSGFQLMGVKNPCTVAEHVFRATQIGYLLAVMEGDVDPERVVAILIIHDNPETRTGDQHKVAAKYFSKKEVEARVFQDQLEGLGEKLGQRWNDYFEEYENRTTREGIVAKDADWLEVAFQAKEYLDSGFSGAQEWIDNVEKALETESAKNILDKMKQANFNDWYQGLKKMTYSKLNSKE